MNSSLRPQPHAMRLLLSLALLCAVAASARAANAFYFALEPAVALPTEPSSLLLQSPTQLNVPAGAVPSFHLLRDDKVLATSRLTFGAAYLTLALFPPAPVASFHQTGTSSPPGQTLTGATLDTIASQSGGQNMTTLLLTRLSSAGTNARLTVVNATGDQSAMTARAMNCQTEVRLPALRLNPTLNALVPADATGWMKVSAADDGPVFGLYLNTGRANTGGNLRAFSYAADFRLRAGPSSAACRAALRNQRGRARGLCHLARPRLVPEAVG